ncbi:MAG: FG-GAP-like repeat-containing protein, partial [Candidatus Stygibacter australis]|nr:FG-GAP-like repeat-containing protein [Candidatus Stygibacter australis]
MKKVIVFSVLLVLSLFAFGQVPFELVTENFNSIDVGDYSAPTFTDLDGDGLLDMLIGDLDGNINHYEQDAENSTSFSLRTSNFNSIDVGMLSAPTFTDLDEDGLLDMLIGGDGGNIYHYEQNTINSLSFSLCTSNFNSIDVSHHSKPAFTDLDGDGLLDMLIGEHGGNINHYEQNAENSTSFNLVTENFNSIAVGDYSEPTFTDLDGDSLLDMIIGEGDGKINHYEQIAENSTSFVLVTENFNSIDVGSYSVPTFTDLDGDGRLDMLIGERYGNIYHYVQNAENSTSFVLVTENFNSINVGQFSKPTFTDLNGNGLLDMLIGEIYGKIYHYEQNIHSITDFTLDHATGTIPLEVQFTDLSRLDVTNWQWDFDNDGNIDSYEQNPVYTYTETGTYTVSLTVSDEDNTYTETVTKNDLIATFIFSEFTLLSPSSYSVDIDIFPRLEWTSALSSRNLLPIYEVYISKSPIFTAEQTVIYETQNTYLYPSRDLELGTTYFWKVKATDHLGNEIWSNYNGTYWMLTTVYQTEQQFPMIDGLIADNRTLISENSPYWLSTEPHTAFNKDLTIESGVTLKFNSGVKLEIGGNLFIYGTVDDLVNIDGYSETSGRWHGIEYIYVTFDRDSLLIDENYQYISGNTMQFVNFNNCNTPLVTTADMYINSCNIENTLNGISQGSNSCIINTAISNWNNTNFTTGINGGKIFINNSITGTTGTNFNGIHSLTSNAVFDANIITYNGGYGIHGSSGVYTNNIVTNNGGFGIRGYSGDYLDNTVNENGLYGIYCGGNGNFTNNTVNDNGGDGIFGGSGDYIDNIVTNNGGYGIRGGSGNYTSNTVNENGEYGIWGVSGDYTDNTVTNNEGYGINGSSGNYSSNTVNENGLYGIHVDGNGDFTNNTVNENGEYGIFGGNGNYDNNTVNLNNGYGIDCGEVAVLNQNEVSNNGGFGIKDGLSFQNNIIDNNTGYGVQAFIDAILSDNTITNSGDYGLLNGVLIENNEISNNGGFGIDADEEATINNNVIHNNDGFAIHNGKIITNNTVTYNEIDDVLQINTDLINSNNIKQFSLNTIQNNILEEYLNDSEAYSIISFPLCDTLEFDNNIIENNETDDYCIKVSGNDLSITNNIIAEFIYSDSPEQNEEGVALWIEATGLNNIIDNNTIIDNGENYRDATIYIADADSLYITHNVISGNLSGGIYLNTGNIAITDNTITGNDIVGSASAIYLNGISAHSVIERNVITNNIGSYAIYGSPETFTQNNIFYNYSAANDTVLCNLRYTGTDQISYPYNFWGTRSDQGNIDPSIYDDNENGSIGMVLYQPILTAPSPLTPGQLTMIDTVVVTINGEELLPNTSGVADGQTVYLCLIGEDGNEFSVDLTEVNIINMTTFFPLQPLMWETGENTGIFRSEISISSTIYNPEQNIMRANAGDTLMISSVIDPSKVFYLPIIEMGFNMPESITINEDESFSLDMTDFITFPGNDEYLLFGEGNEFIDIAIDGMMVTFSPQANWNGAELITFGIDVQEQRYDYQDSLLVIINPVNDAPIVVSEIGDIVMNEDTNDNSIDLTEIFTDIDDDELAYSYSESTNISVEIAAGIVTLTPASDWFGEETMV